MPGSKASPGSIPIVRPVDVPPQHWQRFVDDVGRFLDSPFCAVAGALGCGRSSCLVRSGAAIRAYLSGGTHLVAQWGGARHGDKRRVNDRDTDRSAADIPAQVCRTRQSARVGARAMTLCFWRCHPSTVGRSG
jgi:hypothetical protein